ncbi:hypothetical protein ACFS27_03145 [Promicromonospora vindobonensis]|uniref:Uncharacterized protein n=1 Tax=Promicromonospora vindobonensis TaxID=195748 RepID=A0ABW5VRA0_9MICO
MTATAPSQRAEAPDRAGPLPLAAALLLALSGLFALPVGLVSQAYYSDSWDVATIAAPASVLPTLVLSAAAVAYGSRVLLLVTSGVAVLHLMGLVMLAAAASAGPKDPTLFLSGPAELGLALVGLAMAWWNTGHAGRRPWIALLPVVLAPVLGLVIDLSRLGDWSWWPIAVGLLVVQRLPVFLTVLAAGLLCLPARGARLAGTALVALAGLNLYWLGLLAGGPEPQPLRYAAIGLALVCAVIGVAAARPRRADDGAVPDISPDAAPTAPRSAPDARSRALPVAALTVLVLTVALDTLELFAHGSGIQPGAAGILHLTGFLVDASLLAAFTLAAGAATLGSRGVLVAASACSGLLLLVLLVYRATAGWALNLHDVVPFVALGLALAVAWIGTHRAAAGRSGLPWAAVALLVLAASPLMLLLDPSSGMYGTGNPMFFQLYLLPAIGASSAPVLAAALIGFPDRGTRLAAAVLLAALAATGMVTLLGDSYGMRLLAALNVLRIGGYALACVLITAAVLPPRRSVP